jgi:hypothetical protein
MDHATQPILAVLDDVLERILRRHFAAIAATVDVGLDTLHTAESFCPAAKEEALFLAHESPFVVEFERAFGLLQRHHLDGLPVNTRTVQELRSELGSHVLSQFLRCNPP